MPTGAADFPDFDEPSFDTSSAARPMSTRRPKKKPQYDTLKIIGIVCAVIAGLGAIGRTTGLLSGSIESQMKKVEKKLNRDLPEQIDHLTRLDRVKAGPGKNFSYIYTVDKSVSRTDLRNLKPEVKRLVFANKETRRILDAGVTLWYKYSDKSGKKLYEFSIKR
jgi:hypothetical protein